MPPANKKSSTPFTPYQKFVVAALAFLQSAVILHSSLEMMLLHGE